MHASSFGREPNYDVLFVLQDHIPGTLFSECRARLDGSIDGRDLIKLVAVVVAVTSGTISPSPNTVFIVGRRKSRVGTVVDFGGVSKEISLGILSGVKTGDYVLVHAGFAIGRVKQEEAEQTLKALEELKEVL